MEEWKMTPIGHIKSVFKTKNGTPRQSGLADVGRAILRLNKNVHNNPNHALENLNEFSHVWILWIFHQNGNEAVKAKVAPPRLQGRRVGLFSTRTPHRPNPIGLTLARVEKVIDDSIHLSGIDMVDGTPVLDIKPYIPQYDSPHKHSSFNFGESDVKETQLEDIENIQCGNENVETNKRTDHRYVEAAETSDTPDSCHNDDRINVPPKHGCESSINFCDNQVEDVPADSSKERLNLVKTFTPDWIGDPDDDLQVSFSERSLADLHTLQISSSNLVQDKEQLVHLIRSVLASDPRSVYRKSRCSDRLYYTTLDNVHVTAWFDPRHDLMEVLALKTDQQDNKEDHTSVINI